MKWLQGKRAAFRTKNEFFKRDLKLLALLHLCILVVGLVISQFSQIA